MNANEWSDLLHHAMEGSPEDRAKAREELGNRLEALDKLLVNTEKMKRKSILDRE